MKGTIIPIVIGDFGRVTKGLLKELGDWRTSRDPPNYSIIENDQNIEKSHGYLRILAVTQTPVKNQQLKLMWITQGVKTDHLIPARRPDLIMINKKKKKRSC